MVRAVSGHNELGAVARIAGAVTDQTERKTADPLTGLPNRLYFIHHVDRRFERARQTGDWNFSVLSLGLDRFKQINERLGYEGGDALLIEIAERLTDAIAKWKLSPESVIARFTAADFLLCLEDMTSESQSMEAARKIADDLRQPFQWRMRRVSPVLAMGLAQAEAAIARPDELLHEADTALVEAKVAGRGPLVCYSRGMRERALARMQMEADLELAIREQINREPTGAGQAAGQLALYYQPEIDLATRRIIGFEALVRWQHPEHGMVMPGEFIPLAEESGLILPLGDWGLTEACRQIDVWKKMANERPLPGFQAV
jgi:diguanylate cyclase (GGDEF)-like protein